MGSFNPKKKIFQADQKFLKEFPFYQGFFMSDEEFQKQVVTYVYVNGQTEDEKYFSTTIYKNRVGFAQGIPVQKLSMVVKKLLGGERLNSQDRSDIRTYGKNYVPQYVNSVRNNEKLFSEYTRKYNEYASLCQEVLDGIDALLNSSGLSRATKMALKAESLKLKGISKVEVIKSNLKRILGANVYYDTFSQEWQEIIQPELF